MPVIPDISRIVAPLLGSEDVHSIIAEWELIGQQEPWQIDPHRNGMPATVSSEADVHEQIEAVSRHLADLLHGRIPT